MKPFNLSATNKLMSLFSSTEFPSCIKLTDHFLFNCTGMRRLGIYLLFIIKFL